MKGVILGEGDSFRLASILEMYLCVLKIDIVMKRAMLILQTLSVATERCSFKDDMARIFLTPRDKKDLSCA